MSKKKTGKKEKTKKKASEKDTPGLRERLGEYIREETLGAVTAVGLFVISVFLLLAAFGQAGRAGDLIYTTLDHLLGEGYILLPLIFTLLGLSFLRTLKKQIAWSQSIGGVLFIIAGLGLLQITLSGISGDHAGGVIGAAITAPMVEWLDVYVTIIILGALLLIAVILVFDQILTLHQPLALADWFRRRRADSPESDPLIKEGVEGSSGGQAGDTSSDTGTETAAGGQLAAGSMTEFQAGTSSGRTSKKEDSKELDLTPSESFRVEYKPPPLDLLEKDRGKPGVGDIKANTNIIKRALNNFNVQVEMDEVSVGPTVTRYSLKPAEGVKLARIVGLQNDLALALAAHPLRIEAPIPGKSLVGIEIPNQSKATLGLGTLLGAEEFTRSDKPLMLTLGKNITGEAHFANLGKMPHVLIAGATGSGKSATIHSMVTSLIYRNSPDFMRFIMVDPKRVELTLYNSIPHLLTPVITDPKQSILALKWAQKEMDRRYDILETEKVRDISSYHNKVVRPALEKASGRKGEEPEELPEKMPYIVIIIDELADIMQMYPRELESAIVRLAQMSRAVGIHLILSTQRPSVNVITGLIKANIPARIALQVTSQVDSRTILDTGGAEKLLGAGDMLYVSGEMAKPTRLQSPFISEEEVKKVVQYLSKQYEDELPEQIDLTQGKTGIAETSLEDGEEADDDMYEEARSLVIHLKKASTSLIQRKLRLGYARAARLMDMLEERGVVSPAEGAKPRRVLVNDESEELEQETDQEPSRETEQETGEDSYSETEATGSDQTED